MDLTLDIARAQPRVKPVQLGPELTAYVRRLPGSMLGELAEALQAPRDDRAAQLICLCLCDSDGAPLSPTLEDVRDWPPVWVIKVADEASQVNGLAVLDDQSPPAEAGA